MRSAFLQHHGILGQKWGIRRFEDKNGHLTAAGKERYGKGGKKQESEEEKEKFWTEDRIKKAVKIGAVAVGTAVVAYGSYKLATDPHVRSAIANGMAKIKNEPSIEEMIQNSGPEVVKKSNQGSSVSNSNKYELPKSSKLYNVLDDKNPTGDTDNCKDLAVTATCRFFGKDVVAGHNSIDGSLTDLFEDKFGIYDKVLPIHNSVEETSFQIKEKVINQILKRYKEGDVGCIGLGYSDKVIAATGFEGHDFNWIIENGKVVFGCSQGGYPEDGERFFSYIGPRTKNDMLFMPDVEIVRVTEEMADKISKHYEK